MDESFRPVLLGKISEELDALHRAALSEQSLRPLGANVILPLGGVDRLSEMEQFAAAVSGFHPGRFFLLVEDASLNVCRAEVAFKAGAAAGQYCEIVRLYGSCLSGGAVNEAIRAHLIPGVKTEVFLYDETVQPATIEELCTLADVILLDSSLYEARFDLLFKLSRGCGQLVDLRWIALDQWRDALHSVFDRRSVCDRLDDLERIVIGASTSQNRVEPRQFCSSELLFGGWLMSRLGLEPISGSSLDTPGGGRGNLQFTCLSPARRSVGLVFLNPVVRGSNRLDRLGMRFGGIHVPLEVKIERGITLETLVGPKPTLHLRRDLIEDSRWGLLKRYFCQGESFSEYVPALTSGCDLMGLQGDFN